MKTQSQIIKQIIELAKQLDIKEAMSNAEPIQVPPPSRGKKKIKVNLHALITKRMNGIQNAK